LAVTGGDRDRDVVGLYDCDSFPGDCGSLVLSQQGVVGLHAGTMLYQGKRVNAFYPFLCGGVEPPVNHGSRESEVRHSSHARPSVVQYRKPAPQRVGGAAPHAVPAVQKESGKQKKASKRESIVSMSPAPSSLPSRGGSSGFSVQHYVDALLNPWSSPYLRLPDRVVVPTSLARFVKNSTWSLANTGTYGGNLLFALCNRPSCTQNSASFPQDVASTYFGTGGVLSTTRPYSYGPGSIMNPLQWGLGAYADPRVKMQTNGYITTAPTDAVWGDDFGQSMRTSLPYMAAYRCLSMAIRVRIVGLPTGQFMTPGKIYFAQVRCDNSDLPITEQDFSTMEQLGRASHVSADAVRAAGSKTLFYVPDGQSKFDMVTSFMPPCGTFGDGELTGITSPQGAGFRFFPTGGPTSGTPTDFSRAIIPYLASGVSSDPGATTPAFTGQASSMDSHNADSTTYLVMAYFGAQDGVVLEVDYAQILEYIPTKSAPGGVEALVQLPDSMAMDSVFSAAAVMSEARPVMLQQPGDLTLVGSSKSSAPASREALSARDKLAIMSTSLRGKSYREGFWDFDWLKKGSLGDGSLNWDFTGQKRK